MPVFSFRASGRWSPALALVTVSGNRTRALVLRPRHRAEPGIQAVHLSDLCANMSKLKTRNKPAVLKDSGCKYGLFTESDTSLFGFAVDLVPAE